jgi:hypothetical protein
MTGLDLIAAERRRQVEEAGFDVKHDLRHANGELAYFACYYALPKRGIPASYGGINTFFLPPEVLYPKYWQGYWTNRKRKTRLQQLAAAGALIAAEIDRLIVAVKQIEEGTE